MSGGLPAEYFTALNQYRIMWLFAMFDLPVGTKAQRKSAALFRKGLVADGFSMFQYSVYIRNCASRENADVHLSRVRQITPAEGMVSVLCVTDCQFGQIFTFYGKKYVPPPSVPIQLELF